MNIQGFQQRVNVASALGTQMHLTLDQARSILDILLAARELAHPGPFGPDAVDPCHHLREAVDAMEGKSHE